MHIGIITPGGDAPGMNAAIRAVVRLGVAQGYQMTGINLGYSGLLLNNLIPLSKRSVSGIINIGGTILKSSRCLEIRTDKGIKKASSVLKSNKIDYLVVIGGDGTLTAANKISRESGIPVIGIPASIDNDVYGTEETIGFDTAIDTANDAIDKIRDTAISFDRIFIVEVMGREHGFLALNIAMASGAEFAFIPEQKQDINTVCKNLKKMQESGKKSIIIIFAEGAGDVNKTAKQIEHKTGSSVRVSSLGYIQRGGSPSARSRVLGTQFGNHAIGLIAKGKKNRVVVTTGCEITDIDINEVINNEKKIDLSQLVIIKNVAI
ncbi:MAG: hypothetical protein A2252_07030 [Elusimicrobia bacterium RIFOXYA2_FULL_39_19]|nr:MAG: hypothetical protein A2252_07030 [Elusimicrobia bacterium RIFOXYA2_FULL_39_19]